MDTMRWTGWRASGKTMYGDTVRYDAFGNRIKKESEEHQTSYWYNSLNQLINLTDQSQEGTSRETYLYDRRAT